jgi:hypothetical protein
VWTDSPAIDFVIEYRRYLWQTLANMSQVRKGRVTGDLHPWMQQNSERYHRRAAKLRTNGAKLTNSLLKKLARLAQKVAESRISEVLLMNSHQKRLARLAKKAVVQLTLVAARTSLLLRRLVKLDEKAAGLDTSFIISGTA